MPRVKISEFKAKELICSFLKSSYSGVNLNSKNYAEKIKNLDDSLAYVLKVDQGVKKRNKLGLVTVNIKKAQIPQKIVEMEGKGYNEFLLEEFVPHKINDEKFLALERVREGIRAFYTNRGGVNVEEEGSVKGVILDSKNTALIASELGINTSEFDKLIEAFEKLYLSFLETNPFLVKDKKIILLDLAVEVDSAAEFFVNGLWSSQDIVSSQKLVTEEETEIKKLADGSSASFKLVVLNSNGSIFTIFSGGGASIVLADEVDNIGKGKELANYAEYSGGPTEEETYIFAKNILSLAIKSPARNKKIYIAGGVANFTDIRATFNGVIKALDERKNDLKAQNIKVYVRRGGPFQEEGLAMMKDFLEKSGLLGEVMGPDRILTEVITTN